MARRVSLPSADDLFRRTAEAAAETPVAPAPEPAAEVEAEAAPKKPSGRVRHDEKMTVYMTSDELLDIEHARLGLRRSHGLAVDRGRLVREAVAMVLADFEAHGDDSALVRRLTEE
ncbi:hypothetical protein GCM10023349_43020 [Nocardioides conyzicola]|uniref:Cobyrinic acid a,c-diamide synthase n=1 Tax=Nocardioides conyzicola TaxID=1651781 RepID=A0ABP8Y238_9ACTN